MQTDKLKALLKEHLIGREGDSMGISWDQFECLKDTIDECLEGGGLVHVRYIRSGPELQLTYKDTPDQR